jgi:hypothetical protein
MALKKDLNHVNFSDPKTIQQLHLAAYAALHVSLLQTTNTWHEPYGQGVITKNELEGVRHFLLLDEKTYSTNCDIILRHMVRLGILKEDKLLRFANYHKDVYQTYVLTDVEKSRKIAETLAKQPPKNAYRTACKQQSGVPIKTARPEHVVHIVSHPNDYEQVDTGYYRELTRHDEGVREQARKYIKLYMGSAFYDFLKALKGEDLLRDNIIRILDLLKTNAPLLINNHRYSQLATFALQNIDVLDYDYLFGNKK